MPKKIYKKRVLDVRPDRLDLRDREYKGSRDQPHLFTSYFLQSITSNYQC